MIRRSVVLKLWLTIIALVVVVLAILSLYLQQFFDSYVQTMQRRDLASQALLVGELLEKEPNKLLALQIGENVMSALHSQYSLLSPRDPGIATFLHGLSPVRRKALSARQPVIFAGIPTFLGHPDPTTNVYAIMPIATPGKAPSAYLILTESRNVAGDPARTIPGLIIFSVVVGTLLTTGLAFVVLKNLSRPLIEMNAAAEELAKGRFDIRVRVMTHDEVGRLGRTFNHVASQLERNVYALTREKEEIAGILGAMTDAVVATDSGGRLTLLNPAARQWLFNVQTDGAYVQEWKLPQELEQMHQDTLLARRPMKREFSWQGRNVVAMMTPLYEPDDPAKLRGTLAVLRDVTEERRLDHLRKDFVANVSHELRTPLALFQGYAEALLDDFGDEPEQRRELTQIIHDESLRMRRLVNDLLDLAQMESGHFSLHMEPVDLVAVIRRVARKFQGVVADRGVQLTVRAEGDVLPICGDADRLEQVLTNLLDNALKYTIRGEVTLSVLSDGEEAIVRVTDTGEGIPESDLPFVFERFYKADKARTRSRGGTGLGLAIARTLIRAHGGDIGVRSTVGEGTTFSILLPISTTPCGEESL